MEESRLHTMVQLFLIAVVVMSPYLYLRGRALLRARRALRPSVDTDPPSPSASASPAAASPDATDLDAPQDRDSSGELARVVARIEAIGVDGGSGEHEVWLPGAPTSSGRVLAAAVVEGILADALARSRVEVVSRSREPGGWRLTCRAVT